MDSWYRRDVQKGKQRHVETERQKDGVMERRRNGDINMLRQRKRDRDETVAINTYRSAIVVLSSHLNNF